MKALNLLYAFLGGAVVGCSAALLLAPEKGSEVRGMISEKGVELKDKLCQLLHKKGIRISDDEVDALVAELAGGED